MQMTSRQTSKLMIRVGSKQHDKDNEVRKVMKTSILGLRDGRPHYLRRSDLEPMTKGWYEFVCRSILPTTNYSELTVERAMLFHSIIIGENINVEEIITEQIYKFVCKTGISSSLPFPSIVAALCADARIPAIPDATLIPQEPLMVGFANPRSRQVYRIVSSNIPQ
ncbi:hypothetical protein PIB30_057214 [Stylosanthes scabra]|uniref:Putative plant transposon protein domain-containing protein n=1 Tax=Stylosanthes scabra TaxID=79078 RepID=A0ABU6XHY1_9FABA|nr:hypothetical protein [Stylosanthes scabra]